MTDSTRTEHSPEVNPTLAAIALIFLACNREPVLNVGEDSDGGEPRQDAEARVDVDATVADTGEIPTIDLSGNFRGRSSPLVPGEWAQVSLQVGALEAFSTTVRVSLCRVPCSRAEAVFWFEEPVALMAAGYARVEKETTAPLVLTPGEYEYLGVVDSDNLIAERDETNNEFSSHSPERATYVSARPLGYGFRLEAVGCEARDAWEFTSLVGFPISIDVREAYPSAFSIVPSWPSILPPHGTFALEYAYLPPDVGTHIGELIIDFNGQEQQMLGLQGNAVEPGIPYEDTWTQDQTLTPEFHLWIKPEESSISVTVDGSLATDWTYAPTLQSILFGPTSIPAQGSVVVISYTGPDC